MALSYSRALLLSPKNFQFFLIYYYFSVKFGIAWIVQWDYIIITDESIAFPALRSTVKTKWWDALKNDASLQAVKQYFLKHPTQDSISDDMS